MSSIKSIRNIIIFYILYAVLHYVSSHLYTYFCVPTGFYGFLTSLFTTQMPHCTALRYLILTGSDNINMMWFTIGSFYVSLLTYLR